MKRFLAILMAFAIALCVIPAFADTNGTNVVTTYTNNVKVNLRVGPSKNYGKIERVEDAWTKIVRVCDYDNTWTIVATYNDAGKPKSLGFMMREYVQNGDTPFTQLYRNGYNYQTYVPEGGITGYILPIGDMTAKRKLSAGTSIHVWGTFGGYTLISTEYACYLTSYTFGTEDPDQPIVPDPDPGCPPESDVWYYARVRTSQVGYHLNIRTQPDKNSKAVARLTENCIVAVISTVGNSDEWVYVKTMSGQYGYAMKAYLVNLGDDYAFISKSRKALVTKTGEIKIPDYIMRYLEAGDIVIVSE